MKKMKRSGAFHVYIVQCSNGTYYTGSTSNLEKRIELHGKGRGAKYLRGKLPIQLVYAKEYRYFKTVLRAERELKRLTRKRKEGLIKIYANGKRF